MLAVFLDLETTGLDPSIHCPIDLAFKVIEIHTGEVKAAYQTIIKQPITVWERRDLSSMEINGYQWDQIQAGKDVNVVTEEVIALLGRVGFIRKKAFFICQNPAFDRAFFTQIVPVYTQENLQWPYHWLDLASMFWAKYLHQLEQKKAVPPPSIDLSKNAIAQLYGIPPEQKPHKAENGVNHLVQCYSAVIGASWTPASSQLQN